MNTIKVKPLKSLLVRDPLTREPLKASGEDKPRNIYWLRRIRDKSVIMMNASLKSKKETE